MCHYCGFKSSLKRHCSKEGRCEFVFSGPGVERISEEVKNKFPGKKIEIFFNDTGSPALIKDPGDFDSIYVVMPMKG